MGCLFAIFAGCFPRLATLLIWLARPSLFNAAFSGSWLWPVLGIIFLPFTTLMYVLVWTPQLGVHGWGWFWLALAVLIDLSHWGSMGYTNRNRMPGYAQPL
jgi:hypothetical protein